MSRTVTDQHEVVHSGEKEEKNILDFHYIYLFTNMNLTCCLNYVSVHLCKTIFFKNIPSSVNIFLKIDVLEWTSIFKHWQRFWNSFRSKSWKYFNLNPSIVAQTVCFGLLSYWKINFHFSLKFSLASYSFFC